MNSYLAVLKNYAGFSGRAGRKEFWMFALINIAIYLGLVIISQVAEVKPLLYLAVFYVVAVIVPSIAVTVRRLHDTGRSGGWYFITFVPFIGSLWLLVLTILDGNAGPNQYGPDPKTA